MGVGVAADVQPLVVIGESLAFSRPRQPYTLMTARCPFCEAVHPIKAGPGGQFTCPCGATALLCAPNTDPATSVFLAELGLSDT